MGFVVLINGVVQTFCECKDATYRVAMYLTNRNAGDLVQIRDETTGEVTTILPDRHIG
jgi:hypothetical protein